MEKNLDEYEPFGEEWKKEMMKLRKDDLIDLLRSSLIKLEEVQSSPSE